MFAIHDELSSASRARGWVWGEPRSDSRSNLLELTVLVVFGVASAVAVTLLEFKLRLPGHAILRAIFPMALGLSLVPRRGAGVVMGASAAMTLLVFLFGWGPANSLFTKGAGSTTSLLLAGPVLEMTMRRTAVGWRLYRNFVLAGVLVNFLAFLVQCGSKWVGWDSGGGKPVSVWIATAAWSYPLCGAVAGLVSAGCWFRWYPRTAERRHVDAAP